MKLVICDYDNDTIHGINEFINKNFKFDGIGYLNNCHSFAIIEEMQPDIVIMNVTMYEDYRTQITQKDFSLLQHRKLIFISDRESVQHARIAIYAGALDFITKPIHYDDFFMVLSKAINLVNLENDNNKVKDIKGEADKPEKEPSLETQDIILCGLLDGRNVSKNITDRIVNSLLVKHNYFISLAISVSPYSPTLPPSYDYEQINRLSVFQEKIKNYIEETIGRFMPMMCCIKEENLLAGIIVIDTPGDETRDELEKIFNEIQKNIRNSYGCDIAVGIGVATPYANLISLSYQQAYDSMRQCIFFRSNAVFFYSDNYFRDSKGMFFNSNEKKYILKCIYQCDAEKVKKAITSGFLRIRKTYVASQNNIMTLKIELAAFINEITNQIPLSDIQPGIDRKFILEFFKNIDLEEIETLIYRKLEENIIALSRDRSTSKSVIIDNVKRMVRDNMKENSSVKTIAYEVGITPNYLSTVFRDATGICLSEFISGERMKKAAELLLTTNIKISDIADSVGCGSQNYFSKLFKDYYGVSPNDYRNSR